MYDTFLGGLLQHHKKGIFPPLNETNKDLSKVQGAFWPFMGTIMNKGQTKGADMPRGIKKGFQ
jgi:hypothetical protein